MGTNLSNLGTSAQFAPIMKRAVGQLSTGEAVVMVPDANIAGFSGDDATGTAKIRFYKSDTARTGWALSFTYTPSPAASSSTVAGVLSMVLDSSNHIHLVWAGTNGSLNYVKMTYGGSTWTAGSKQEILASSAITTRFRAVDIDVASANPAVIIYEASASTGQGAYTRLYVQMNDGTTWIKAYEIQLFATSFIKAGSEDVSVSYNTNGVVSNVGQYLIYYTKTSTVADSGDIVRELSFNTSTGTTNSATTLGTWPVFNLNVAAGTRRGWIFKSTGTLWQVAMVAGLSWPKFQVMRLTHNAFGAPTINSSAYSTWSSPIRTPFIPTIYNTTNAMNCITCVYNDNRVMFGFVTTKGPVYATTGFTLASYIFRYLSVSSTSVAYTDTGMRPLDNYFAYGNLPIGIYGASNNRNQSGDYKFNFLAWYGYAGNTADPSFRNIARFVLDTSYDAPSIVAPSQTVANDRPTLQARVENDAFYPNVKGKLEWTLARDGSFTSDPRTITEPDSAYRFFGSSTASPPPPISVAYQLTAAEALDSDVWFQRARVVDDLGGNSDWSEIRSFIISHPPTALPSSPAQGSLVAYGAGNITFSWQFSDTETTDEQSAYQIIIIRQDTGATVLDTGKVVSSVLGSTQAISSGLKNLPLQWSVSLWDSDDVQGPFSNAVLFTLSDAPVVSITSPVDESTLAAALPTVAWTPTLSGGRTQRAFRVYVYEIAAFAGAQVGTALAGDSGWVQSTDGSYTFTSNIFSNLKFYSIHVQVQDSGGLIGEDENEIETDWTGPALGDITTVTDDFGTTISWTDANVDGDFAAWRIYRRYMVPAIVELDDDDTANLWVLIYETDVNSASYSYKDYLTPLNRETDYAVVQVADRFGSLVESDIDTFDTVTIAGDRYFFVPSVAIGAIASYEGAFVTDDSYINEVEQETLHIRGRGRQVQVGDDLGWSGSLTIKLRNIDNAAGDKEFFERLASSRTINTYMKTPFGHVKYVKFGNVNVARIPGVGTAELTDLTIPYLQVIDTVPVTRAS